MIAGGSKLLEGMGCIFTKGSNLFILLSGAWEEQVGQANSVSLSIAQCRTQGCSMSDPGSTLTHKVRGFFSRDFLSFFLFIYTGPFNPLLLAS